MVKLKCTAVFLGLSALMAQATEITCPPTLQASAVDGWEVVAIDSEILRKKPHLRVTPRESRITVTREFDRSAETVIPDVDFDDAKQPDGSWLYVWDFRGIKPENRGWSLYYFTCVYAGEAWRYARKPMSPKIDRCWTTRSTKNAAPQPLICEP